MIDLDQGLITLLETAAQCEGCTLWGAELIEKKRSLVLAVYVDAPNGIQLDQCAAISRSLRAMLRANNRPEANYFCEVSSPGIERKFFNTTQYAAYLGSRIRLHLRQAKLTRNIWEGILAQCVPDGLVLNTMNDGPQRFQFNEIKQARLMREQVSSAL